jgi:hypothetical protein
MSHSPGVALVFTVLAIFGQIGFEPAHILHHLRDSACETTSTASHDECADCAIFHSGAASSPALEIAVVSRSVALGFEVSAVVADESSLPVARNSRAPPSNLA